MPSERVEGIGRAHVADWPTWVRGPATLENGTIVLDAERAKVYHPGEETELLYDLAAIRRPRDAVDFVARHGLLRHGPDAEEFSEPFADFEQAAHELEGIIRLWLDLREAVAGDAAALERLRSIWREWMTPMFQAPAKTDDELLTQASVSIQWLVNEGLSGNEEGIIAAATISPDSPRSQREQGAFLFAARPRDLLGFAYHQLAMDVLVSRAPLATCAECGRIFNVHDRRQRFCTPKCASRARARRFAERKRKTEAT